MTPSIVNQGTNINWLTLDVVLACLFPFAILIVCFRAFPSTSLSDVYDLISLKTPSSSSGSFSPQTAWNSYASYPTLAKNELSLMRQSYSTLSRTHKRIGYDLGYPRKLERLQDATDVNAVVTNAIADLARIECEADLGGSLRVSRTDGNVGRVRESLKHFVRDWSEEGKEERDKMFKSILDVFRGVDVHERVGQTVLVPGCGLGRLAWEISQLGYDTTANELSYFMTFAFRFLLSPTTTTTPNEHVLRPYAHWFSHQRTTDSVFRPVFFPDVVPRLSQNFHLAEKDFLFLTPPSTRCGYHYIVTLFFIDTSLNAIETIEHIYALLRPGGTWINLGPLLWTGGAQAKVELSLEEVINLAEAVGFVFDTQDGEDTRGGKSVHCEYTADTKAMMKWIYLAEFWVARKPK